MPQQLQDLLQGQDALKELLASIGVTTTRQLVNLDIPTAVREMNQAIRILHLPYAELTTESLSKLVHQTTNSLPNAENSSSEQDQAKTDIRTDKDIPQDNSGIPQKKNSHNRAHAEMFSHDTATPPHPDNAHAYRMAKPAHRTDRHTSRLERKGIKHHTPIYTCIGALCVVYLFLSIFFMVGCMAWDLAYEQRSWLSILICFLPFIIGMIFYLSISLTCRCSVCRAQLFSFKRYTRNKQAHCLFPLGYVLSTALHLLLFRWFRCPACGTPQQLSKKEA